MTLPFESNRRSAGWVTDAQRDVARLVDPVHNVRKNKSRADAGRAASIDPVVVNGRPAPAMSGKHQSSRRQGTVNTLK